MLAPVQQAPKGTRAAFLRSREREIRVVEDELEDYHLAMTLEALATWQALACPPGIPSSGQRSTLFSGSSAASTRRSWTKVHTRTAHHSVDRRELGRAPESYSPRHFRRTPALALEFPPLLVGPRPQLAVTREQERVQFACVPDDAALDPDGQQPGLATHLGAGAAKRPAAKNALKRGARSGQSLGTMRLLRAMLREQAEAWREVTVKGRDGGCPSANGRQH